jgi:ribosome-binding factor A
MNHRQERINDSVAQTVGEIIRNVKDPGVASAFVTVNAARVTPDLKFAKIYFGTITGDPVEVQKGLERAAGFIRSSLATKLNLRQTPEITFIHDRSAEHGAHIAQVLKELNVNGNDH